VELGAVLDRGRDEPELCHELLLRGIHTRNTAVQLIETRSKLGEGGLGARRRLSHRIQYQLCLQRRLGRRRGDSFAESGQTNSRNYRNQREIEINSQISDRSMELYNPRFRELGTPVQPKPRGSRLESDTNCYTRPLASMVAGVRHTIA
jgi:hypothetical protein